MIGEADILRGKILIVDDQEANILLLEGILVRAGYVSLSSTQDPEEVSGLHLRNRYDLILLDLEMPALNGFEVMKRLQDAEPDGYIPVLAITANAAHKHRALKGGAKDFVSKPFDRIEVLMRVHNMLEVRLAHEAAVTYGKVLESLALNDPLTGLANRRRLDDRMSMALAHSRRKQRLMAVIYLDLDEFKQINDTMGHGAGDLLLKEVAGRLAAMSRTEDTVARLGGDEFVIMLSEIMGPSCAATVALKAIAAVSLPFDIEGRSISITTSAGIGIYPTNGEDAVALLESADLALYEAKRAGKNAYRISERTGRPVRTARPVGPRVSSSPPPEATESKRGRDAHD